MNVLMEDKVVQVRTEGRRLYRWKGKVQISDLSEGLEEVGNAVAFGEGTVGWEAMDNTSEP